jgi:hypothetical protein
LLLMVAITSKVLGKFPIQIARELRASCLVVAKGVR